MTTRQPKATLVSTIQHPVETIYILWLASRGRAELPTTLEVVSRRAKDDDFEAELQELFRQVILSDIPVAENLEFIFMVENMPISLREQIVRHRIGHKFGENIGVDLVPGPPQDSFWSQSMRVLEMGEFFADGEFYLPDSIAADQGRLDLFDQAMALAEASYRDLLKAGVAPEDARQVIPLAASHRMSWKMNFMSVKHILGRRGCWIAQLGMWRPLIQDLVRELATKVHPLFRSLIQPPCFSADSDHFLGCPFPADNAARLRGEDPEPPCPIWLSKSGEAEQVAVADRVFHPTPDRRTWDHTEPSRRERFAALQKQYAELWGRNAWTGARQ